MLVPAHFPSLRQAHMTKEAEMLKTDPVYKWAQTRWPTCKDLDMPVVVVGGGGGGW